MGVMVVLLGVRYMRRVERIIKKLKISWSLIPRTSMVRYLYTMQPDTDKL